MQCCLKNGLLRITFSTAHPLNRLQTLRPAVTWRVAYVQSDKYGENEMDNNKEIFEFLNMNSQKLRSNNQVILA